MKLDIVLNNTIDDLGFFKYLPIQDTPLVHVKASLSVQIRPNPERRTLKILKSLSMMVLVSQNVHVSELGAILESQSRENVKYLVYAITEDSTNPVLEAIELDSWTVCDARLYQIACLNSSDPVMDGFVVKYLDDLSKIVSKSAEQRVDKILKSLMTDTKRTSLATKSCTRPQQARRNKTQIKIQIKRALEQHGIGSRDASYPATHRLIYENLKFRMKDEVDGSVKVKKQRLKDLLDEQIQAWRNIK